MLVEGLFYGWMIMILTCALNWAILIAFPQFQVFYSLKNLESLNSQYSRKVTHTCAFNLSKSQKKLTLSNFEHPCSELSTIAKLPKLNLKVLKFLDHAIVGERWEVEDEGNAIVRAGWKVEDEEFLKLKYLKLSMLLIHSGKCPILPSAALSNLLSMIVHPL